MKRIFTVLSAGLFTMSFAQQNLVKDISSSNPQIYHTVSKSVAGCIQEVPSNNLQNGSVLGDVINQAIAADILVPSGDSFTISSIKVNLIGASSFVNLIFYSDIDGKPGAVVDILNNVNTNSVMIGTNYGFDFYRHTVNLSAPLTLSGGTKFWMEVQSDARAWENQNAVVSGSNFAYRNSSTSQVWMLNGVGEEVVYTLEGNCAVLGVDNTEFGKLAFYPNPVKSTITFAEKVSQISIFDMTGKSVKSILTNANTVDLSFLTKGNYIIQYTTKSGKKVSNKLIKY